MAEMSDAEPRLLIIRAVGSVFEYLSDEVLTVMQEALTYVSIPSQPDRALPNPCRLSQHFNTYHGYYKGEDPGLYLGCESYSLWCRDGKKYTFALYFDKYGKEKGLTPNQAADALIDAGRFASTEFNIVDVPTPNQRYKDRWGPNYVYGDVIVVVPGVGSVVPDLWIVDPHDPLEFILTEKSPCDPTTNRKFEEGTDQWNMAQACRKRKTSNDGQDCICEKDGTLIWENCGYIESSGGCWNRRTPLMRKFGVF